MSSKNFSWLKRMTPDVILLLFCTFICFASIVAAMASLMMPEAFAATLNSQHVTDSVEAGVSMAVEDIDEIMVWSNTIQVAEIIEPEPITITTTRLGVIVDSYDETCNYNGMMQWCAEMARDCDDPETYLAIGEIYEARRNLKIMDMGEDSGYETTDIFNANNSLQDIIHIFWPPYMPYTEYEAIRLAMLIHGEAGSWFVSDEHQRDVASVVVNRVNSSRFPRATDIVAAIESPGQYPGTKDLRTYTERELANAIYVLENGPTTTGVFQANFIQGPVVAKYDYNQYGWKPITYICT